MIYRLFLARYREARRLGSSKSCGDVIRSFRRGPREYKLVGIARSGAGWLQELAPIPLELYRQ